MPSHTTSFFFRLPNSRQLSFRRLGTSLCFSGALATALGGCATLNSSPSASAEASSTPTAASHATAPVLQDSEGFRLFTGRGPVEEAVFEGPAAPASYSYVEFERRGEPEGTMKVRTVRVLRLRWLLAVRVRVLACGFVIRRAHRRRARLVPVLLVPLNLPVR